VQPPRQPCAHNSQPFGPLILLGQRRLPEQVSDAHLEQDTDEAGHDTRRVGFNGAWYDVRSGVRVTG
jgi:hypothetical protein